MTERKHNNDSMIIILFFSIVGIGASIFHLFGFNLLGKVMWPRAYQALLIGLFMSQVFLKEKGLFKSGPLNVVLFFLTIACCTFFFINSENIEYSGWEYLTPLPALISAMVFCVILMTAIKKTSGLSFFIVCFVFFFFPLFSHYLPSILRGTYHTIQETVSFYIYGTEAVFGLVMDVMGNLLMGFIVFSVVLEKTGGGEFFINLGFALLGHRRGGPAKVAVISSGFFGSISGSPLLNVAVTGSVTIPAMKKLGYDAVYAGAVEACASTASVLMPPVMGATAFLICQVIGVPYTTVILAAAVPAVLYFVALLIQVDLYAAHHGLVGLPKDQIPSLIGTLKGGWPYIFALLFLVYQLIVLRTVTSAPYYSSLALIIAYLVKTRGKIKTIPIKAIILGCGSAISSMIVVLLGVGIIIGALTCTGVAYSFTNEVIMLAGDKPILLMALGAVVAFFLGMGLTISAVYIFLAMTLAPPLVAAGFDKLAVHLFIMYCGMLSEITPPVCLAAYTAAGISGANHFKTGITSMRLGLILYVLPFVFLNNPALILKGSPLQIIQIIITFIIGIIFLVSGTENHLWGLGSLAKKKWLRLLCLATGSLFLIATTLTDLIGLFFGLFVFLIVCWFRKRDRINASRNIL